MYNFEIIEGRFFDRSFPSDVDACVINESTVREYNLENPLETIILSPGNEDGSLRQLRVIGVTRDFHFEGLSRPVDPYIMRFRTNDFNFGYITARLDPKNMEQTINEVETVWKEFTSNDPINYFFLDEDFATMLRQEKQSARLSLIFAFFAIIVAALGLFGLTSFMLQRRTKEIGIRKSMGASVTEIYILITRNVSLLVLIAAIIGTPLIYLIADKWLQNYHFRINPGMFDFLAGFILVFILAIATISYRTLKAARVKPAHSLKYE